jgi:hypothetical protein
MKKNRQFWKMERRIFRLLIVISAIALIIAIAALYFGEAGPDNAEGEGNPQYTDVPSGDDDRVEDGIHVRTGLIAAEGMEQTITNCTTCHSAQLIIQNRQDREGWIANIRWMQETQNLWDLGENEEIIVNYLVKNYPAADTGRRENLEDIEWYVLKR